MATKAKKKTPAKKTPAKKTPAKGGKATPAKGGKATPAKGGKATPAKKTPSKVTPGKGGKGSGGSGDGKRFVVEIGTGGYVRATQRAMDKLGLSSASFAAGEEKRGSKGTKSIKIVFSDGSKISVPVPGTFKRSDYAEIASSASGEGYVTPDGVMYRIGDGGGGGGAKKTPAKKK